MCSEAACCHQYTLGGQRPGRTWGITSLAHPQPSGAAYTSKIQDDPLVWHCHKGRAVVELDKVLHRHLPDEAGVCRAVQNAVNIRVTAGRPFKQLPARSRPAGAMCACIRT